MIEQKVYDIHVGLYKHALEDTQQVLFVQGFPQTHEILSMQQGRVNDQMRQFFSDLAVVFGIHIAISDSPIGKDIGE